MRYFSRPTCFGRLGLRALLVIVLGLVTPSWVHAETVEFELPDLDGKLRRLSEFRGKWVLVNYWATWCPPCLEELPELELFHSKAEGRAVVLGVNMESISSDDLRTFVDQQFLSYPILVASENPRREQILGPVDGLPTSYLVTPAGEVVARQVGPITAEAINAFIERYESRNRGEK